MITDGNGNSVTTETATFTMASSEDELNIVSQPEDMEVANTGDKATATVVAEGTNLSYTWYYYNPNAGLGKFLKSSTTGNSYSTNVTEAKDGFQVYCVITDGYGNSVTTETVTFKIAE